MSTEKPREFIFLLCDQFSILPFTTAVEPLRIANRMAGRELYKWRSISEKGGPVMCSAQLEINVDGGLIEAPRDSTIIVCSGLHHQRVASKPVIAWLRRESRRGPVIGGVCTGAYVLAKAGLLEGKRATIHWENRDGFREEFENVELTDQIFVQDGDRLTAAGGAAPTDLILNIISQEHGPDLAALVADQLIYSNVRTDQDTQRLSLLSRIGVRHPKLSQVITMMEENIEEPISASELARNIGMSTRQLERLFRRYMDRSPKRYYLELRLEKARRLLLQTELSVINVALACGFTSPSHFSKCYRNHFQRTPYRERGVAAGAQAS